MSLEPKNGFDDAEPAVWFELEVVVDRMVSSCWFNTLESGFGERVDSGGNAVVDLEEVVGSGLFDEKFGNTALL